MRPAIQRKMRVVGDNPCAVPLGSPNPMDAGGKVHEAKATTTMSPVPLSPVPEIDLSAKIELRLFPIDEVTRAGLEKDGHHPYLELVLRPRKKIASVLKHIDRKWGSSSVANGEPVLFPYNTTEKTAASCRWTADDSEISAGEVYAAIGYPTLFRLRYGWTSNSEPTTCPPGSELDPPVCGPLQSNSAEACTQPEVPDECASEETINVCDKGKEKQEVVQQSVMESSQAMQAPPADEKISLCQPENDVGGDEIGNEAQGQSASLWADSLTNISIGGLISEASLHGRVENFNARTNGNSADTSRLISESLDAFITAHTNYSRCPMPSPSAPCSSIFDAEDTCHAFSFKRQSSSSGYLPTTSSESGYLAVRDRQEESGLKASKLPKITKDGGKAESQPGLLPNHEQKEPEIDLSLCSRVYNDESSLGLAGMNWIDSLGPFDLGLPSRRL